MVGMVSRQPTENRASHPAGADDNLQLEIRAHLEQRWSSYFPSLAARTPEIVCRRGADWRGFSVMLEYELTFDRFPSEHVLAKVRRDSKFGAYRPEDVTVAPELLRREFDELSRAFQYFEGRPGGLRVVRPLEYCDELNAMFIEKASGCDLGVVARTDETEALAAFRRCGLWLRAFHEKVHESTTRVWMVGEFEGRLARRRDKLESLGAPPAQMASLFSEISTVARRCRQRDVPFSLLHGDYKLRHIWARPGIIQVFDFGNVHTGACYVDVAAFLVELSVLRLGHPWFDKQKVERYSQAFLNGYFTMRPPPVLGLYVVEALLKKWMRRRRTWSRTSTASMLHAYVRRIGAKSLVERWYLDRWFASRIREALQMADRGGNQGLRG